MSNVIIIIAPVQLVHEKSSYNKELHKKKLIVKTFMESLECMYWTGPVPSNLLVLHIQISHHWYLV